MHSFHQSRSRIVFEVFCALAISASCAGAWMQTGAWALLPAAAAASLYAVVHSFDLGRRRPTVAADPQRIDFAADQHVDLPAPLDASVPLAAAEHQLTTGDGTEDAVLVEPAPQAKVSRRAKAPGKGGGRRTSAPKEAKVAALVPPAEAEVSEPVPGENMEVAMPVPSEDVAHFPLTPLFEPEPFVRQQRAAFGRKAG